MRSILVALGATAALAVRGVQGVTFYGNTSTTTVYVPAEECGPITTSTIYYTLPVTSINADVGGLESSLTSDSLTETIKTTQTSFVTIEISSLPSSLPPTTTIQSTATFTTFVTESGSYPATPSSESIVPGTTTLPSTTTTTKTVTETSHLSTYYETLPTTTGTTTETAISTVVATPVGPYSFGSSPVGPISSEAPQGPGSASSLYTTEIVTVESQSLTTYSTTAYITSTPSPSVQSAECTTYVTTDFLTTVYVYTLQTPTPSLQSLPTGSVVVITSEISVVPEVSGAPPSTSSPILESHTLTLTNFQTVTETLVPETTITLPPVTYTSVYAVTETLTPATTVTSLQILETTFPVNPASSSSSQGLSSTMSTWTVYTTISYTISECPTSVTHCPYGSVTTETISQYVTTCPVADLTSTLSPTAYGYGNATQISSPSITASEMSTSSGAILPTAAGWNTSYSASGSVGPIGFSASGVAPSGFPASGVSAPTGFSVSSVFNPTSHSQVSSASLLSSQTSGFAASSGFPVPSANSSVMSQNVVSPIQTSGFATSSGFPSPSVNSSVLTTPVSSFSVFPVQTSVSAASSGFALPTANSSVLATPVSSFSVLPVQTSASAASSSFTLPTANSSGSTTSVSSFSVLPDQTSLSAASSGFALPTANSSVLATLVSSFSVLPVQTSVSAASSSFALPTADTSVSLSTLIASSVSSTASSLQTTSATATSTSHHIIPILATSESSAVFSASATTTSTGPNTSSTCGEHGDFTLNFDDVAPLSAAPNASVTAEPLFSPYHQFYFSENFHVVPLPIEAYNPSSGKRLLEFAVTNVSSAPLDPSDGQNLQTTGGIGNGYTETLGCFGFNVYGASLGCASQGPPCVFQITGMRYNASIQMEQFATSQTIVVPSCPAQKDCALVPTAFDDTFVNLNSIMINATVGTVPKSWFMDDLSLGWTNNTCEAGLCRQNSI